MPENPDRDLMTRFYGCDTRAFDALAERWWPRLSGFFRRLSFSIEDAQDLAQETLVRLYQTKETMSFDVRQPLQPFLFQVARNLAIREWRRRRPDQPAVPLLEAADTPEEETGLPEALRADLFHCIARLPPVQQSYVMLCGKHGLGELSHNEIAEAMGKRASQVSALSSGARRALRECLAEKGYGSALREGEGTDD